MKSAIYMFGGGNPMRKKILICGIILVLLGSSIVISNYNSNEKISILNNDLYLLYNELNKNYKFPIMEPDSETLYR